MKVFHKCSFYWGHFNGVEGYIVTGPSGCSIFIPKTKSHIVSVDIPGYHYDDSIENGYWVAEHGFDVFPLCVDMSPTKIECRTFPKQSGLHIRPVVVKTHKK